MAAPKFISSIARRLHGKVALITGGASGIGECTARVFASHGAKVVIADAQDELGQAVCESIGPSIASYIRCDVTNEDQVKAAVQEAIMAHGKLDIMFNNAGVTDKSGLAGITDQDESDFDRVVRVNVKGTFLGIKHAGRAMVPARSGCILSTASMSSGIISGIAHAYTCSKHAIVGLTKSAAADLGRYGIRVNCISPFMVATPMLTTATGADEEGVEGITRAVANLKGPTLKAEDVANAALFLASEEGRYISGHNLFVDGGFSIINPSFQMIQQLSGDHA